MHCPLPLHWELLLQSLMAQICGRTPSPCGGAAGVVATDERSTDGESRGSRMVESSWIGGQDIIQTRRREQGVAESPIPARAAVAAVPEVSSSRR